jgi:4-hydroxy-tetrahydrodipicolinate synthase
MTERFIAVGCAFPTTTSGAHAWAPRSPLLVPLLFAEANPMPIKNPLWRQGLIASPECRLPMTKISMRWRGGSMISS